MSKMNQFEKAFLLSAGTETTEVALKLMRLNGAKYSSTKKVVLCFEGNWHGRTMGSQMLAGKNEASKWIGFFDKNIYQIDFPYPWHKNSYNKSFFHNIVPLIIN